MQNNITLPGAKLGGLSPLSWGLIVAGILFFAIVVIVRSVTATGGLSGAAIGQATQAGVASIEARLEGNRQNSVGGALPAFSLQSAQPVTDSPLLNPQWLERVEQQGRRYVWADSWFDCGFIQAHDLTYRPVGVSDPALATGQDAIDIKRWDELVTRTKWNIIEVCRDE